MSDAMSGTMKFEVITAEAERLSRSPSRSYRHWSEEEKARIVGATFSPGANVSAIARAHEIDPSQLFTWRRKALASGLVAPLAETTNFRPVQFARFEAARSTQVEIVVGDVVVRAGPDVASDHLAAVLRAVCEA
jgi:transposase